jgi:hypothetical protein
MGLYSLIVVLSVLLLIQYWMSHEPKPPEQRTILDYHDRGDRLLIGSFISSIVTILGVLTPI